MPIILPPEYVARMSRMLGEETDAFLRSYDKPRTTGLRINRLKVADGHSIIHALRERFGLTAVPWCADGFFYDETTRPGRHIYHAAGLFYIQEPSAMIAAELLDPLPGETVLDLAAAPGGKTTQLAAKMRGEGLLVANEIHPARAKILSENVERMGITNALVTQASPQELAARFPACFDRVLLDAPCSGEGMFRKDPDAIGEWSPEAVDSCASRQRDILPYAASMVNPGGHLVYSTCTFNTQENEETIAGFLADHTDFRLLREERLWPHRHEGEGHYAALLRKEEDPLQEWRPAPLPAKRAGKSRGKASDSRASALLSSYESFAKETLPDFRLPANGQPLAFGEALFWIPVPPNFPIFADTLDGLKVLRAGLHLGDFRTGGRFEPNHALAMAVSAGNARLVADFAADSEEAAAFWRGEAVPAAGNRRGWGIAAVDGFPFGWFKASDGLYKNRRPKGLRFP